MITLTIATNKVEHGRVVSKRELKFFHSLDKAVKTITPIASEMELAKKEKRVPTIEIVAASYDTDTEKTLLLNSKAIITSENEY